MAKHITVLPHLIPYKLKYNIINMFCITYLTFYSFPIMCSLRFGMLPETNGAL